MKISGKTRQCPRCQRIVYHKSKISCYYSKRKNTVCGSCRSSLQMINPETRKRRIRSLKQVKHTSLWHNKIAKTRKKNGSYIQTDEMKERQRIIKIERMIKNGILIWPNFNENACQIFKKLEDDLKWDGFYATKGKEKRIGRFWVDYFEPNKNVVIEYDEIQHFNKNGKLKLKDVNRQKWIENRIGCKFFRINEKTNYGKFKNLLLNNVS